MRHPVAAAVVGLWALALAIPTALLGRAVLATPAAAARESREWPAGARVVRSRGLAERAARSLLGADGAERLARIAQAYRHAAASPAVSDTASTALRLAQLARRVSSPVERSQAHVMVGAVFALPAGNGGIGFDAVRRLGGGAALEQSAQEFRAAIVSDDRNEAAKYDLELLLKDEARSRAAQHHHGKAAKRHGRQKQRARPKKRNTRRPSAKRREGGAVYSTGTGY